MRNKGRWTPWVALACLVVPMFGSYFFDDMFSSISFLFSDPSRLELGWDAAGYGLYTSGYSVLCVFGGLIVCGMLLDKWGVRITGSIFVGLMAAGLDTTGLVVYGTAGNALGSMFNYCVGRLGKPEWIERYLHVSNESLKKAQRFMAGRGAWMGFFTFLPILGSAIAIALGLMRANVLITFVSITLGKLLRYVLLAYGAGVFI